jgi:hypothetical protein
MCWRGLLRMGHGGHDRLDGQRERRACHHPPVPLPDSFMRMGSLARATQRVLCHRPPAICSPLHMPLPLLLLCRGVLCHSG